MTPLCEGGCGQPETLCACDHGAPFKDRLHRAVKALCEAWERNPQYRDDIEDVVEEVFIKHSARLVVELLRGNGLPADLSPPKRVEDPSMLMGAAEKLSGLKGMIDSLTHALDGLADEDDALGSSV